LKHALFDLIDQHLSFLVLIETVRGLGADLNSDHMQNYNDRTASDIY